MLSAPSSSQYTHSHNNEHKKQTPEEYLEETGQMLDRSTAAHQSIPNINIQMYEPDTPVLPTPFTPYTHTPFHPINRHLGLHSDMDLLLMSPSMPMNPHSTHSIHSNNSTHLTPTLSATHFMHSPLPITFGQGHHHAPSPMINIAFADESSVYLGTSAVYSSNFNSTDILASPPADSENHFLDSFLSGGAFDSFLSNSPMPPSSSAVDPLGNTDSPTTAAIGLPLFHHQQKKQNLSNLWINTSITSPQPQLQSPSQHMSYHHNSQVQSPMLQMPLSLHQQQATFLGDLQNSSLSMNSATPNTFLTVPGTGVEFDSMSNYSQSSYGGDDDDLYLSLGGLSTPIPPSSINGHLSPYPQWTQHDSHSPTIGNFHSPLMPLPHPYPSSSTSPNPKKRKASDQDDSPNKSTSSGRKPHACAYEGCTMSFDKQANLRQHILKHTGELPYACTQDGCTKRYSTRNRLNVHMSTHTGILPHICPTCNKGHAQMCSLRTHMVSHMTPEEKRAYYESQKKTVACGHCGKGFKNVKSMDQHSWKEHKVAGVVGELKE